MTIIYSARNIRKAFGPTVAVSDVTFEVPERSIVGLVGMNGAGKSTMLRIIAGALAPDAGELLLDGKPVSFSSTAAAHDLGIAIVSQELSLFPALTVEENLRMRNARRRWPSAEAFRADARRILRELGFAFDLSDRVRDLGLADRQLVEIARALLQEPRILVLDEPTSALHASEVERLHLQLRRLRDAGVGVVYVTHFLEDLLDVCDNVVVLRNGRRIETPDLSGEEALTRLVAAMLGDVTVSDAATVASSPSGEAAATTYGPLVIRGLSGPNGLEIESLTVQPGEILGLAGLVGSGVEDLFRVLFGFVTPSAGDIRLPSGQPAQSSPARSVAAGVAYTPADRKAVGLMQRQSIAENVASVRALVQGAYGTFPNARQIADAAERRCRELGVKMASVHQLVSDLSGGNQQKVVFAKWLEANPSLLLLDDPTRGIDVRAREEIHAVIRSFAVSGKVVLLYSSDPAETVNVATRTAIFVDGRLAAEVRGEDQTEHNVVTLMNSSQDVKGASASYAGINA